jgi:hypothetical protein
MEYRELLDYVAPCGLNCVTCLAFERSEIRGHALALLELLGPNFDAYAERFSNMNPVFEHYRGFKMLLSFLGEGSCGGCRKGGCLFRNCVVHRCVQEKGVDFCFECKEFPCEGKGLHPPLYEKWKQNNEMMKALGVRRFHEKTKDLKRYP